MREDRVEEEGEDANHRRSGAAGRPLPVRGGPHRRGADRPRRVGDLGISGSVGPGGGDVQALPGGPGPAPHRAPLAVPLPVERLPRRRDHGGALRDRHRALGHRRQALRGSSPPAPRRTHPGSRPRLLPRVRGVTGGAGGGLYHGQGGRVHRGRPPDPLRRRPARRALRRDLCPAHRGRHRVGSRVSGGGGG